MSQSPPPGILARLWRWLRGAHRHAEEWPARVDRFAADTTARLGRAEENLSGLRRSLSEVEQRLVDRPSRKSAPAPPDRS